MEVGSHECVACGVVLRASSVRCPACGTDVGAETERDRGGALDASAILVDAGRQQLTDRLRAVAVGILLVAIALSIATSAWWGVAGAVVYAVFAIPTAPKPLSGAPGGQPTYEDLDRGTQSSMIAIGFGFLLGIVIPGVAMVTTEDPRGRAAALLAIVATVVVLVFRSRRETDADGFTGRGVPID